MDPMDIARRRLRNLRLCGPPFEAPDEVVGWLTAVQSQDYGPGKWSIGERTDGVDDATVDGAYAAGTILRTHVLRPTWHFVTPADIRWLLELTGPRVHVQNAYQYRQLGLDVAVRRRCTGLLAAALERGNHPTRGDLAAVLRAAGVATDGFRLAYILMSAELDGVICSGTPRGRQHTYALLDERVAPAPGPAGEAALAELVLRYLAGHGPATVKDLRWWSSLTVALLILDGQLAGHWKRTVRSRSVVFEVALYHLLDDAGMRALRGAADRQAAFLGRTAIAETAPLPTM